MFHNCCVARTVQIGAGRFQKEAANSERIHYHNLHRELGRDIFSAVKYLAGWLTPRVVLRVVGRAIGFVANVQRFTTNTAKHGVCLVMISHAIRADLC